MEKLTASQQQQLKKMGDDRLCARLITSGFEEEEVLSWEHKVLLARYAEVMVTGGKPEVVDLKTEKQRLALEKQKLEAEIELNKQKLEAEIELKKQKSEAEKNLEKQKIAKEKELETQKLEYEKIKLEHDHQIWVAEQKRINEEVQRRERKDRKEQEWKNDKASRAKKYADAIR